MRLFIIFLLTFSYTLNAQEYANYKVDKAYAIEIHNKARKKVKVNKLEWSDELAKQAQYYADYLAETNKGLFHSKNLTFLNQGENLYMEIGFRVNYYDEFMWFDMASDAWLSEKKLFKRKFSKFSPNSKHYKAGHYTQMVWKNTRQFGMGVSKINNKVYVVARYFPAGNWIGKHIY